MKRIRQGIMKLGVLKNQLSIKWAIKIPSLIDEGVSD
jgi:hypothetical protein